MIVLFSHPEAGEVSPVFLVLLAGRCLTCVQHDGMIVNSCVGMSLLSGVLIPARRGIVVDARLVACTGRHCHHAAVSGF